MAELRRLVDLAKSEDSPLLPVARLIETHEADPTHSARLRVWRRVADSTLTRGRQKRLMRAALIPTAAVAAMAAGILWMSTEREPGSAELASVEGNVEVMLGDNLAAKAERGQNVRAGERIRTDAASRARLRLRHGVALDVHTNSELVLPLGTEGSRAILAYGRVVLNVPDLSPAPFFVVANRFEVETAGAAFEVQAVGSTDVEVRVLSGEVAVKGPSVTTHVRAGDFYSSVRPTAPSEVLRAEDIPSNDRQQVTLESPARESMHEKPRTDASNDKAPVPLAPKRRLAKSPKSSSRVMADEEKRTPQKAVEEPPAPVRESITPEIPSPPPPDIVAHPAVSPNVGVPIPSDEERYRRATLERDPERALLTFIELADRPNALGYQAAVQAARLRMRLSRFEVAATTWRQVIARAPEKALDQEARLSLIECLLKMRAHTQAQAELDRFLAKHPESERLLELRFVRAELHRQEGKCDRALVDYEAASTSRYADDAAYFRAWCNIEIGSVEHGRRLLEDYIAAFPKGRHVREARAALSSAGKSEVGP